jgi:hypothetical protein
MQHYAKSPTLPKLYVSRPHCFFSDLLDFDMNIIENINTIIESPVIGVMQSFLFVLWLS